MIVKDLELIDNLAKQMFGHNPNLIAIDMNDYNQIKANSSYLNATRIEMPLCIKMVSNSLKKLSRSLKQKRLIKFYYKYAVLVVV